MQPRLHAVDRRLDREARRIEVVVDFIPHQGHRDRSTWQRADAERRHDQLPVAVLQVVHIDLVAPLVDHPRDGRGVALLADHQPGEELA